MRSPWSATPYGECKLNLRNSAAARLQLLCSKPQEYSVKTKLRPLPSKSVSEAELPSVSRPNESHYLLEQGEAVYMQRSNVNGEGVRWLFNRRNGKFRKQEVVAHKIEHRGLDHRPVGIIKRINHSNPVSDNFTASASFVKAIELPALSPHQYQMFTKATTQFLAKVYAKREARTASKIAAFAWVLAEKVSRQLAEIEEAIIMAKLRNVQIELDKRVGNSCPDVKVDILAKKLTILNSIQFEGGKAQIKTEDMHVAMQVCKIIAYLYDIVGEQEMLHIRVDGHVQDTGKPDKCLIISYFRAAEIVRNIAKFVPKKFLHPFGYGGTRPISKSDPSLNRRVEIGLLVSERNVQETRSEGTDLWHGIRMKKEFDRITADPAFVGDPNVVVPIRNFAPNIIEEEEEEEGQERPISNDEPAQGKTLQMSNTAPALL